MGEGTISPLFMIRTGKWKFITCLTDPPQLFNLDEDPLEKNNLAKNEEFKKMIENYEREIAERCDVKRIKEEVLRSQRSRRMCWGALLVGKRAVWDFQTFFDTREEYMRNGGAILDDLEAIARYPPIVNVAKKD